MTYSQKCRLAKSDEQLKEVIRDLKRELNSDEIKKLRVQRDS